MSLDPHFASIPVHPAKATRATFTRRKDRRRLGPRAFSIVGMNNREPEVWRREPFFGAVAQHLFDVTADEVDSLIGRIGFAPRFPNHTGNMLHDVLQAATMNRDLRSESSSFRSDGGDEQRHQRARPDERDQKQHRHVSRARLNERTVTLSCAPNCEYGYQHDRTRHDSLIESQRRPEQTWQAEISERIRLDRTRKPASENNQHYNQQQHEQAQNLGYVFTIDPLRRAPRKDQGREDEGAETITHP